MGLVAVVLSGTAGASPGLGEDPVLLAAATACSLVDDLAAVAQLCSTSPSIVQLSAEGISPIRCLSLLTFFAAADRGG